MTIATIKVECPCGGRCRKCGPNGLAHVNPARIRHNVRRALRRGVVVA